MVDDKDIIKRIANGNDPYADENLDGYGMLSSLNKVLKDIAKPKRHKVNDPISGFVGCMYAIIVIGFVLLAAIMIGYLLYLIFFSKSIFD